jgi:hypothetical protein
MVEEQISRYYRLLQKMSINILRADWRAIRYLDWGRTDTKETYPEKTGCRLATVD